MDTDHLKEFIILAETKNFSEAAVRLSTTQPILSKHIRGLEDELGVPLLVRSGRSVHLSEFGETVLRYAKDLIQQEEEAVLALHQAQIRDRQELLIGMTPAVSHYNLTDILVSFQSLYPDVRFRFLEAESNVLQKKLLDYSCDLAFLREFIPENDNTFESIDYIEDTLAAILPIDHPLAANTSLRLEQLKDETFLMLPQNTVMQNLCVAACRECGFEPTIGYSGHLANNILELVRQGMGVSMLSKHSVSRENDGIVTVDIEPPIYTKIQLVFRGEEYRSDLTTHFVEFFRTLPPQNF